MILLIYLIDIFTLVPATFVRRVPLRPSEKANLQVTKPSIFEPDILNIIHHVAYRRQ